MLVPVVMDKVSWSPLTFMVETKKSNFLAEITREV